jgi:hypothetical protein
MLNKRDCGAIAAAMIVRQYCDEANGCIGCVFDFDDKRADLLPLCPFATNPRHWKFLEEAAQGIGQNSMQQAPARNGGQEDEQKPATSCDPEAQ